MKTRVLSMILLAQASPVLGAEPAAPAMAPAPGEAEASPAPVVGSMVVRTQVQGEVDPAVDQILTRLESADRHVRTLSASLRMDKIFDEFQGGERHERTGTLVYQRAGDGGAETKRFAIEFTRLVVDGARVRDEVQQFIFDGSHLLEKRPGDKSKDQPSEYARRRIVAPGSTADPLRIGEGPFPIPVGQRKSDILARFSVTTAPSDESLPPGLREREDLRGAIQLVLTPFEGTTQAQDFREIRIWYRASDLLPVFVQTQGEETSTEVLLSDLRLNAPPDEHAFDTRPPDAGAGWVGTNDEDVRERSR